MFAFLLARIRCWTKTPVVGDFMVSPWRSSDVNVHGIGAGMTLKMSESWGWKFEILVICTYRGRLHDWKLLFPIGHIDCVFSLISYHVHIWQCLRSVDVVYVALQQPYSCQELNMHSLNKTYTSLCSICSRHNITHIFHILPLFCRGLTGVFGYQVNTITNNGSWR